MTDIREGDLVKATNGERVVIGRAQTLGAHYLDIEDFSTLDPLSEWDLEVLDRPLPPISDELLKEAVDLYRETRGFRGPIGLAADREGYPAALTAVINLVRKYDAEHDNKESAK